MEISEGYRIEWLVDADDVSDEGYESVREEIKKEFEEDVELVQESEGIAVSGALTVLTIFLQVLGTVAAVIKIVEFLCDKDDTAKIRVWVPEDTELDVDDLIEISGDVEVELYYKKN